MNINGYVFDENEKHDTSSAHFWKAKKGTEEYFLKRYKDPKRPSDRVSEAVRKLKNDACDDFSRERKKVLIALKGLVGGNIIAPVEFFEYDKKFYQATKWREIKAKSLSEISAFSDTAKELLLKTASSNLKVIHKHGIIHLDIKPDNLPVSVNEVNGKVVCTLIDFDSSYFENYLPAPELTAATDPYMSPELASYKMKDDRYGNKVTTKNDVFALAIVFHEYWTGRKFIFDRSDDKINGRYLYQAVDNNEEIKMAPGVPEWLEYLLRWMIKKNPADRPDMSEVLEALNDHSKIKLPVDSRAKENLEREKLEREKLEREKLERERLEREKLERERLEREKLERDRIEREKREHDRLEREKRKHDRLEREKLERDRIENYKYVHSKRVENSGYTKGPNFPSDAVSFDKMENGNIKITFANGSKMVYTQIVAIRKGYIVKI